MKYGFFAPLTGLLLSIIVNCQAQANSDDTAASVLRVALPAAAWGMTQYLQDDDGSEQFYYSLATTIAATYALKSTINKERPDGSDNDAFPSGHTSMAFQGAAFIQRRYGWQYGTAAYALASYVGYTRVKNDHHDTEDVLAGALIGIAASYYFTKPFYGVQISPIAGIDGFGLRLQKRW